jgi:hypothetical protein
MKEAETMIQQEDDTNANGPRYASLTAGLLARKGEAVPAAAAFTAEAIAQHIPARRLAQEAEHVLTERHKIVESVFAEETASLEGESSPAALIDDEFIGELDQSEDRVSDQQRHLEKAILEDVADLQGKETLPSDRATPDAQTLFDMGAVEGSQDLGLGIRPAFSVDPHDGPLSSTLPKSPAPVNLEDSDENWFEDIVSQAISEAGDQRKGERGQAHLQAARDTQSVDQALATLINEGPRSDISSELPATRSEVPMAAISQVEPVQMPEATTKIVKDATIAGRDNSASCGGRAEKVRQTIRSGKQAAANKSAMRLDPRRFIRLSLAAQKLQLTNQDIMMASLDTYLDALDEEVFAECSCMKKGLI